MTKADLEDRYVRQHQSTGVIARELGCSVALVNLRLRDFGIPRRPPGGWRHNRTGPEAPNWKGGRRLLRGYVQLRRPDHPEAQNGYVWEHRVVMEQTLGRRLRLGEVIHHVNHIRDDNRPENLILLTSQAEHGRHHHPPGQPITQRGATSPR
jgi:hypothetical protein